MTASNIQRVLITAGAGGIGRAIAMAFASAGARVHACDIDPAAARESVFFIGSVNAVRSGAFDVVVANISEIVIGPLKPEFDRVAKRQILSGFRNDDGEWACVVVDENGTTEVHR